MEGHSMVGMAVIINEASDRHNPPPSVGPLEISAKSWIVLTVPALATPSILQKVRTMSIRIPNGHSTIKWWMKLQAGLITSHLESLKIQWHMVHLVWWCVKRCHLIPPSQLLNLLIDYMPQYTNWPSLACITFFSLCIYICNYKYKDTQIASSS